MIRDYVAKIKDQDRVCLVDLDKGISYHSASNNEERKLLWNDTIHLTPAGYDRIATLVFDAIKSKL
jgi:lysophospholipase L1-like esterase